MTKVLTTDSRGRATLALAEKNTTYRVTKLDGGSLLLEPARVMTAMEMAMLRTPGLMERVDAAMTDPHAARAVQRRSRRA